MAELRRFVAVGVTVTGLLAAASGAGGQTRMIQGGNALDANPLVGSGGINYAAPQPRLNRANSIMTGNVGGGAQFRGYSPIRDSSQFFMNLPSAGLSGFRADGISVADLLAGQSNFQPRYYYDASRNVTSVGTIPRDTRQPYRSLTARNFYQDPRLTFTPASRDPIPFPTGAAPQPTGAGLAVEPAVQRAVNPRLLSTPLFPQPTNVPLSQLRYAPTEGPTARDVGMSEKVPLEVDASASARPPRSPLDRVLRPGVEPAAPPIPPGEKPATPAPPAPSPAALNVPTAPEWLGRDRFADMAATARILREQYLGLGASPAGQPSEQAAGTHAAWVREYLATPVRSLAGTGSSATQQYLRRAEEEITNGQYYRAAGFYEMAATLERDNPLPLLGRSFALIAAGEYMSAANLLSRAIETFPGIAYFTFDLKAFIPAVLERRRAELEELLAKGDDYRLRFLLGYLEYYGSPESAELRRVGLENLAKAALKAPAGSPIAQFPDRLKEGRLAPLAPIEKKAADPTTAQDR